MSITSANAVFMLGVASVYTTAQQLQGFGADDAFTNAAVPVTETRVGVDGYGTAGYVPRQVPIMIRLLPDSPSIVLFETWIRAMDSLGDVLYASAAVSMRSAGLQYTMPKGILQDAQTMADARRVLADREFRIMWLPNGLGNPAVISAPI